MCLYHISAEDTLRKSKTLNLSYFSSAVRHSSMGFRELALLLLLFLPLCSAQSTYYVTPTPDTPCPGQPCYTFPAVVDSLTSDTILVFLPGNYSLETSITFAGLDSLTLSGDTSSLPQVTTSFSCSRQANIVFTSISELCITDIALISCGSFFTPSVQLDQVFQASIANCIFQGGQKGALAVFNSNVNLANNTFKNNSATFNYNGSCVCLKDGTANVSGNTFTNNCAGLRGGGIYLETSTANVSGNTFTNNCAGLQGGGIYLENSSVSLYGNLFNNNTASYGGGMAVCRNSTVSATNNTFTRNIAEISGGGIDIDSGVVATFMNNIFEHNEAQCNGGGFSVTDGGSVVNFTLNSFISNTAYGNGGGIWIIDGIINVIESIFTGNSATVGGGLYVSNSTINFTENSFMSNAVKLGGAGITLLNCSGTYARMATFRNNFVSDTGREVVNNDCEFKCGDFQTDVVRFSGGAMLISNSNITFMGNISIDNSNAEYGGGIMALESNLTFSGTVHMQDNTAIYGGGVCVLKSFIIFSGLTDFANNHAEDSGGAVYAVDNSQLYFEGTQNINFTRNTAANGGGLYLDHRSLCYFSATAQLDFVQNHAREKGGAIYVYDAKPTIYCNEKSVSKSNCFFQVLTDGDVLIFPPETQTTIDFSDNIADEGGDDLYGGSIDNCELPSIINSICPDDCMFKSSGDVFNTMTTGELDIASEPLQVTLCSCVYQTPNCSPPPSIYPGQTINISVTVLGQRNGSVLTSIQTDTSSDIAIPELQKTQSSTKSCSNVFFTISSSDIGNATLTLSTDGPCSRNRNSLTIEVQVQRCPHGFNLSNETNACECDERLKRFADVTCHISNETVFRPEGSTFWVGNDSDDLIFHPGCPFDYCRDDQLYVNVDDSDIQCNYNRVGKLCGGCSANASLVLGSSRCMQCSDNYLSLIIVFAFAGIALVFFLFILKLTVASGTINGLIFYANIVQVNSFIFYKQVNTNLLTVFISWLNLDFGIETCFYNGMDASSKAWLQFVFPIYVWSLVGVIILISHFSRRITSLLGSNPIAVLATLFLLSYARILRTLVDALSFRFLDYPDLKTVAIWPYDGNIEYFSEKHTPLFIIALLSLIFLFLPFTLLLFLGQWLQTLQAKTEWRFLSWINKPTFRAFLDAYHAPYTSSHRYWTGLLLIVRCVLFVLLHTSRDTRVDLFTLSSAVTGLITFVLATAGIYRNHSFSILEASFFLNLVLLATATSLVSIVGNSQLQAAVPLTSLSIAFMTFVGIVIYHILLQIRETKMRERIASQIKIYRNRLSISMNRGDIELVGIEEKIVSNEVPITTTYVELREPLIDDI